MRKQPSFIPSTDLFQSSVHLSVQPELLLCSQCLCSAFLFQGDGVTICIVEFLRRCRIEWQGSAIPRGGLEKTNGHLWWCGCCWFPSLQSNHATGSALNQGNPLRSFHCSALVVEEFALAEFLLQVQAGGWRAGVWEPYPFCKAEIEIAGWESSAAAAGHVML